NTLGCCAWMESRQAIVPPSSAMTSRRCSDHLVGAAGQAQRERKAERPRRLEINGKLNFCDLLHRQVGDSIAPQKATGVVADYVKHRRIVRSIAHEPTSTRVLLERIDGRNCVVGRQCDDLIPRTDKKWISAY